MKKNEGLAFELGDGFEFSSNGFEFKTFIEQIDMTVLGVHNGMINFATVYELYIDIECLGREHGAKKMLDSIASDEILDENRPALADTFKQGSTFAFEKNGHTFYSTVEQIDYETDLKFVMDWNGSWCGPIDTRISAFRWKVHVNVVELDPKEITALSKYVGDGS